MPLESKPNVSPSAQDLDLVLVRNWIISLKLAHPKATGQRNNEARCAMENSERIPKQVSSLFISNVVKNAETNTSVC